MKYFLNCHHSFGHVPKVNLTTLYFRDRKVGRFKSGEFSKYFRFDFSKYVGSYCSRLTFLELLRVYPWSGSFYMHLFVLLHA